MEINSRYIRVIEKGVAYGNQDGRPFNYDIKSKTLKYCDVLGKTSPKQDYAERFALEIHLNQFFSEDHQELLKNTLRNNG